MYKDIAHAYQKANLVNGLHLNGNDRDSEVVPLAKADDTAKGLGVVTFCTGAQSELKVWSESGEWGERERDFDISTVDNFPKQSN